MNKFHTSRTIEQISLIVRIENKQTIVCLLIKMDRPSVERIDFSRMFSFHDGKFDKFLGRTVNKKEFISSKTERSGAKSVKRCQQDNNRSSNICFLSLSTMIHSNELWSLIWRNESLAEIRPRSFIWFCFHEKRTKKLSRFVEKVFLRPMTSSVDAFVPTASSDRAAFHLLRTKKAKKSSNFVVTIRKATIIWNPWGSMKRVTVDFFPFLSTETLIHLFCSKWIVVWKRTDRLLSRKIRLENERWLDDRRASFLRKKSQAWIHSQRF